MQPLGLLSIAVALSLEGTRSYRIDYTGADAADESKGADMVLHGIKFVADEGVADIGDVFSASSQPVDVYTLQGVLLRHQIAVVDLERTFPSGVYLINGKKLLVR